MPKPAVREVPPTDVPKPAPQPGVESAIAAALLGNLSPEHMKELGLMLEQDWKKPPEWGEMAIAILKGDFMRPGAGWWKPTTSRYGWTWLQNRCDANRDGKVGRDELPSSIARADLFFDRLDRERDGVLTAADFDYTDRGLPMLNFNAMKARMVDYLFFRLDEDTNGRVSKDEITRFFARSDRDGLGFITSEDLMLGLDEPAPTAAEPAAPRLTQTDFLRMFFRGELGVLDAGPAVGDPAPDFMLPTHDLKRSVKLSDLRGKRPVVLVFGSFT